MSDDSNPTIPSPPAPPGLILSGVTAARVEVADPAVGGRLLLTTEETAFLKQFASDAVAGRHVLCLFAQGLVALGKIAFALSVIGALIAMLFGWRVHQP